MNEIGIGLIGSGFMGKCHAMAFGAVRAVFGDVPAPRLEILCDTPADKAQAMAAQFGFKRAMDDWCALVTDPAVDIVAITTPNKLHGEMALAAIAAGKHVYCEKPMGLTLEDARAMRDAARAAGVRTLVGYNYTRNPALVHARQLIESGAIGRATQFRGVVDEDYQADGEAPWSWRCVKAEAGLGALGDLGCHLVSVAMMLMGPIESLTAELQSVYADRPQAEGGERRPVENEDAANALVRFASGAKGSLGMSRTAWGRKNRIAFEIHGTHGSILYDQERMNELSLFQLGEGPEGSQTQGFRTILTGPAHPPYDRFCPAPGHGLGFNDLKVIDVAELLRAIRDGTPLWPDFDAAFEIERVIHAMVEASEQDARFVLA